MHCEFFYRVKRTSKINFLKPIFLGAPLDFVFFIANGQGESNSKTNFTIAIARPGVSYFWRATGIKIGVEKNHFAFNEFGGLSHSGRKCAGVKEGYFLFNRFACLSNRGMDDIL